MRMEWLDTSREQFGRLSLKLPQALLIQGEPGVGKSVLAMEIVASLLCDSPDEAKGKRIACGACHNCTLFESGNHPDFHYVSSEAFVEADSSSHLSYAERYLEDAAKRGKRKPRRVISVDQIRALIESFALSQHSAVHKVAVLQPAGAMNVNAANALLKLLEEPNPQSVLILVCHEIADLPMTIRSRCVAIKVEAPLHQQAIAWLSAEGLDASMVHKALSISNGAPLRALCYCQSEQINQFEALLTALVALLDGSLNAIAARSEIIKLKNPGRTLSWLQLIMKWLILLPHSGQQENAETAWRAYEGHMLPLFKAIQGADQTQVFRSYDDLIEMKKQDVNIANLSLMLDKWLIAFSQRCATLRT